MLLFDGKTALITGAANGIGKAIAKEFFAQGANIVVADIDVAAGESAAKEIRAQRHGGKAVFVKVDITDETDVKRAFHFVADTFGRLDILVNNAAILIAHAVKDFPLDDWQKVYNVNIVGAFLCSKTAVNHMIANNINGCILNISAASSRKSDAEHAAYSSSKAAMLSLARILALEVGGNGIRVNSILPGACETDMLKNVFAKVKGLREDIIAKTVLGKLGQPQDIANAAVFLCSDMASHITGEYLVVSGGEFFNG